MGPDQDQTKLGRLGPDRTSTKILKMQDQVGRDIPWIPDCINSLYPHKVTDRFLRSPAYIWRNKVTIYVLELPIIPKAFFSFH